MSSAIDPSQLPGMAAAQNQGRRMSLARGSGIPGMSTAGPLMRSNTAAGNNVNATTMAAMGNGNGGPPVRMSMNGLPNGFNPYSLNRAQPAGGGNSFGMQQQMQQNNFGNNNFGAMGLAGKSLPANIAGGLLKRRGTYSGEDIAAQLAQGNASPKTAMVRRGSFNYGAAAAAAYSAIPNSRFMPTMPQQPMLPFPKPVKPPHEWKGRRLDRAVTIGEGKRIFPKISEAVHRVTLASLEGKDDEIVRSTFFVPR